MLSLPKGAPARIPLIVTKYHTKSMSIARLLCANLALAHVCGEGTRISLPFPRAKIRERKTFSQVCATCQESFPATRKAAKYCSPTCRGTANMKKYRHRKKASPAHYADLRAKRNMAWIRFYRGTGDIPHFPGRKTKLQSLRVTEFHRAKTRLQKMKRNRTIHQ